MSECEGRSADHGGDPRDYDHLTLTSGERRNTAGAPPCVFTMNALSRLAAREPRAVLPALERASWGETAASRMEK